MEQAKTRADLLARLRSRVRSLVWLNPDPPERWRLGDAAIESYRPHCDAVLECSTPERLIAALGEVVL